MNADHLGDLATPINAAGARPAGGLALPKTLDQFLAKFTNGQRVDGVINAFTADVGFFKIHFHEA